jgi:hydrogenase-1 operon protein HyaE
MNYAEQRAAAFAELLARLARESGIPTLAADDIDAAAAEPGALGLLYTGDPSRSPESWDVCVVLPELLAVFPDMRAAILDPSQSAAAAARYGIDKLPALVVLRDGEYIGVIEGMRDWDVYIVAMRVLRDAPGQTPPVAGRYPAQSPAARSA